MVRGQLSSELVVIIGVSLLLVLIIFVLSSQAFADASLQQNYRAARDSVEKLADAAESVYLQGEGASQRVFIEIPPNANLDPNLTYIGKPANAPATLPSRTININIGGTDISSYTTMPIIGAFPQSSGRYMMKVTAHQGYVSVSRSILSLDSYSVAVRMAENERREIMLRVYAVSGHNLSVTALKNWNYVNVSLNVSPTYFTANSSGFPLYLNISSVGSASGFYSGSVILNTTLNGSAESLRVPVSVWIYSATAGGWGVGGTGGSGGSGSGTFVEN
ncbi:MAG: hypothetical protein N3G22_04035 [Candidatus Micrarchaeota archaeon]|nr:hypothetical protein [Candidatus Micrarchaeota archaeon]